MTNKSRHPFPKGVSAFFCFLWSIRKTSSYLHAGMLLPPDLAYSVAIGASLQLADIRFSIMYHLKRFLRTVSFLVVCPAIGRFFRTFFWFGDKLSWKPAAVSARSLVFSSVAPPVARVPSKGSLSLILPSRAGPLLTEPRTAMPFDRHTFHWLFAPRIS